MKLRPRWTPVLFVWAGLMTPCSLALAEEQQENRYTNLKVLPKDISRDDLSEIMLDNLRGLGLPRRAGKGCLFCHAGSLDVPRADWDYASDEKPMKQKARVMMKMVQEINQKHLSGLSTRSDPQVEVSCHTCHARRTNPMPLQDALIAEFNSGGIDALDELYRDLRTRYYGADAYDFRISALINVANQLQGQDAYDAAAAVHALNIEHYDEPRAYAGLIQLHMLRALETDGIDAMVKRYHTLKSEYPETAFTPSLLGPLSWGLFRNDQQEAGFRLFELGYEEYPEAYWSTENLAWGCQQMGDHERALKLAQEWVATHPDHEMGQRLVKELHESEDDP